MRSSCRNVTHWSISSLSLKLHWMRRVILIIDAVFFPSIITSVFYIPHFLGHPSLPILQTRGTSQVYRYTTLPSTTASVSFIQSQWRSAGSRSLLGVALLYVVHPNFWAGLFDTATALHPDGSIDLQKTVTSHFDLQSSSCLQLKPISSRDSETT